MISPEKLLALADSAREHSYSPYSGYTVGAALLATDGSVYTGCNIENASFSSTVCAERVAIFRAIADGKRSFSAIAVTGGRVGQPARACPPCGVCRQVMAEFCDPQSLHIYMYGKDQMTEEHRLDELLPFRFEKDTAFDDRS